MRKLWLLILVSVIVVFVLLFSSFLSGIIFQKIDARLIAFLNTQKNIHVQLLEYHRGWRSSEAKLSVEFVSPISSEKVNFVLLQHIKHGPFVYDKNVSSHVGLAVVTNTLQTSSSLENFLQTYGIHSSVLDASVDFISFRGHYFKHFSLANFNLTTSNKLRLEAKEVEVSVWFLPSAFKVQGKLAANQLLFLQNKKNIILSDVKFRFNQHRMADGFWVGDVNLSVPELTWRMPDLPLLVVTGLQIKGDLEERNGLLQGKRKIDISKIQVENEKIGPIQLYFRVQGLKAQTILDMIALYQEIKQRGEFYRSELDKRLANMLPRIVTPNAAITLEKCSVASSDGSLQMWGQMKWPEKNFAVQSSILEMLDVAKINASIHISKTLVTELINLFANSPYLNGGISKAEIRQILNLEENATAAMRQNALLLAGLVDAGYLTNEDAQVLLSAQKNDLSGDKYFEQLRKLYLTRAISREHSYLLAWSYLAVQAYIKQLDQLMMRREDEAVSGWKEQLAVLVKKKLVKDSGKEYSVDIVRDEGVMKLNGRVW